MPDGRRRLAAHLLKPHTADIPDWPVATVTAITVGGGTDGLDLVTVNYAGSSLKLSHFTHYTPAVGHVVALGRSGGSWIILGRLGGFPPAT
jgi:hypothetical protein